MDAGREVEAPLAHGAGPAGAGGSAAQRLAHPCVPGPLGGLRGEAEVEPGPGRAQPPPPGQLHAVTFTLSLAGAMCGTGTAPMGHFLTSCP